MGVASIEEYMAAGMDVNGYLEPEVTSDEVYPAYLRDEVEKTISDLQKIQGFHTATIGLIADIHYATRFKHTHLIRLRRTFNAYREIAKAVHSEFLVIAGDHVTNGTKSYVSDCYRALRSELDGVCYLPINGNHDDNSIWDTQFIPNTKSVNHLSPEERYTLFYNHTPGYGAVYNQEEDGLYYYIDNKSLKIRYIVLDTGDIPYKYDENGKLLYLAQWKYAYSQGQIEWLIQKALRFDEDGWAAVVFQHVPPLRMCSTMKDDLSNIDVLHEILKARKNKVDLSMTVGEDDFRREIEGKFSEYHCCDIVGVFSGHIHMDDSVNEDGIQYTTTVNSVMYRGGNPLPRRDGDKSELAFDMITIDRKRRFVSIRRVGAGSHRTYSY